MNAKERINCKFILKYWAFGFTVFSFLFFIVLVGIQYFCEINKIIKFLFGITIVIFFLLNYLYWKFDLRKNIGKKEFVLGYMEYFILNDFNDFQYIESVRWFSINIHQLYLNKGNQNEEAYNLINKLHMVLNDKKNGFSIATYHRELFIKLCSEIKKNPDECLFSNEEQKILNEMKKEKGSVLSTARYIKCMFFETPLIYFTLLTLNVVGCYFVAEENFNQFMGNFLLVMPNNVLLILGYFNILKEKYNQ